MIKSFMLLTLFGLSLGFAQEYSLSIDGQVVPQGAITMDGQIYVPLEALTDAGVTATISGDTLSLSLPGVRAAGGADQRPSMEGCMDETFFNGIWRVRVLSLEPISKDGTTPGWGLTIEMRNGAQATLMPVDTGISGTGEGIQLVTADGSILPVDPYDVQQLTFSSLPQGGGVTHQLTFYYPFGTSPEQVSEPVKFLFEMKPDKIGFSLQQAGVAYSTPAPSLRIALDCQR
jgi:hypothetical protein